MNGQVIKTDVQTSSPRRFEILANLVAIFHSIVVIFVLLSPFTNIPYLLVLHITFSISLLIHWWGNSNICSLSVLESKLRGLHYTDSFTHRFIGPVYDVSNSTWSTLCYVIVIVLALLSSYKLYTSKRWEQVSECYHKISESIKQNNGNAETSLWKKLMLYLPCVQVLVRI